MQTSWLSLRAEFPHLKPAQLHHMLREYNSSRVCPSSWTPSPDEAESALQTCESNNTHTHSHLCQCSLEYWLKDEE